MKEYKKLLEPGYIGTVRTKNRMLRMGAFPGFCDYEDGYLQQYYVDIFEAFAKGGAGLLSIGVSPLGAPQGTAFLLDDDKYIPKILEMNQAIHAYGTPTLIELFHIGPWLPPPLTVAASSLTIDEIPVIVQNFPDAKALTVPEIKDIVKKFAEIAERAKRAGFDGIEISADSTCLFNTFLSRGWNKRLDEYGCATLENRARIVVDVIQEIRKRNGKEFAIVALFNAAEPGLEYGITLEEGQALAKIFEAAGVDAIHPRVEFYMNRRPVKRNDSTHFPDVALYPEAPDYAASSGVDIDNYGAGGWVPFIVAIKKAVNIPVIATGRLDADMGEKLLRRGVIDFVNLNRRMLADHDYVNKIIEGRFEDIAPCTACMTCFYVNEMHQPLQCRVNAAMGREREYEIKPAPTKKTVVVIGGGPAGMEASRVAALRGHQVVLLEKEPMLGGAMNMAAVVKGTEREDLIGLIEYLKTQISKAGVDVRIGTEADREVVAELKADVVIVATGGSQRIPDIPGINRPNVLTSQVLHNKLKQYLKLTGARLMTKLVTKYVPVGKQVVIMGGTIQGCQTAEFLVKRGRKVTIVESAPEIGEGLLPRLIKPQLLNWLEEKGVPMLAGVTYEEIIDKGLVITTQDGTRELIKADTIVTALPLEANPDLYYSLKGVAPEVYAIGDSETPGLIVDAIAAGARIAHDI